VFLKARDVPGSQLNPDWDKKINFSENNFFQQISHYSTSSRSFPFLENLLKLQNPWECIIGKFLIQSTPPLWC